MDSQPVIDCLRDNQYGEHLLKTSLEAKGFSVRSVGHEHPLSPERLRKLPGMDTLNRSSQGEAGFIACHDKFPLAYWHAQVQTGRHPGFFSLDTPAFQENLARERAGMPVVAAFLDIDRRWFANWIGALLVLDVPPEEGSISIDRASALPLNMLLAVTVLRRRAELTGP